MPGLVEAEINRYIRAMETVTTLAERKRARIEEIRDGFSRLREALSEYGRTHEGRFWVYGSAAVDRFHHESDIDLLVDFDESRIGAALDFAEQECGRLRLKADIQPRAWCKPEFFARLADTALVLP